MFIVRIFMVTHVHVHGTHVFTSHLETWDEEICHSPSPSGYLRRKLKNASPVQYYRPTTGIYCTRRHGCNKQATLLQDEHMKILFDCPFAVGHTDYFLQFLDRETKTGDRPMAYFITRLCSSGLARTTLKIWLWMTITSLERGVFAQNLRPT